VLAQAGALSLLTLPTTSLLEAWDARTGVTEAGTGVASWLGLHAGINMAQATDGNRPSKTTTGGHQSILFNGSSDVLTTAGLSAAAGPRTIYAVIDPVSVAGTQYYFDSQTGRFIVGYTVGVFVLNDGSNRASDIVAATGLQKVTVQHGSSLASTWKNGVAGAPVVAGANKVLGGTSSIGATYTNSSRFSGHVVFLAIYNATRNAAVEAYLQQEFGV
jgi:hypothetical protein